jgi:hypothetical protein
MTDGLQAAGDQTVRPGTLNKCFRYISVRRSSAGPIA